MRAIEAILEDVDFAVVDVETTGLLPDDRVIEVACVKLRGATETERFATLIDPGRPVPAEVVALNGIDDALLAGAPSFARIAPRLDALLEDAVFVAHNAPFDLHYLSAERRLCGAPAWGGPVIDTLPLARNAVALPGYSLGALRTALSLDPQPAHRALGDALTTAALLQRLWGLLTPPPRTLADLQRAQQPLPLAWEEALRGAAPDDLIARLHAAHCQGRAIDMDYESSSARRVYRVRPEGLERNGPLVYLRATLAARDERRTFRLDRIRELRAVAPDSA